MPIYFGDEIQNQNGDYPVLDLTGNHAKGMAFINDFTKAQLETISLPRRAEGMLIIVGDPTSDAVGKVYMWLGADQAADVASTGDAGYAEAFNNPAAADGNGKLWRPIGDTPLQTVDIPVQLEDGRSFGRYVNGETIQVLQDGSNALDIIIDAVTGFVSPDISITTGMTTLPYAIVDRDAEDSSVTVSVTNNNQKGIGSGNRFKIARIELYEATDGSSTFTKVDDIDMMDQNPEDIFGDLNTVVASDGTITAHTHTFVRDYDVTKGEEGTQVQYYARVYSYDGNGEIQLATQTNGEYDTTTSHAAGDSLRGYNQNYPQSAQSSTATILYVTPYAEPVLKARQIKRTTTYGNISPDFKVDTTSLLTATFAWLGPDQYVIGSTDVTNTNWHTAIDDTADLSAVEKDAMAGEDSIAFRFAVHRKTPVADLTGLIVERQVDGGTWLPIAAVSTPLPGNGDSTGVNITSINADATEIVIEVTDAGTFQPTDTLKYRVKVQDDATNATGLAVTQTDETLNVAEVTMYYPTFCGRSFKDNLPTATAVSAGTIIAPSAANRVTLASGDIDDLADSADSFVFVAARKTKGGIFGTANNLAGVQTAANMFWHIWYPDNCADLTTIQEPGSLPIIGAFATSDDSTAASPAPGVLEAFTSNSVSYTNAAGFASTYRCYRSKALNPVSTSKSYLINNL